MNFALHPVSATHPRILGSRADLQALAAARPEGFRRMADAARAAHLPEYPGPSATDNRIICMALTAAVENDDGLAREAVDLAFRFYLSRPILRGHNVHGWVTGICGMVYDLCHAAWQPAERTVFYDYMNAGWDANLDEETDPFHNGWYGYKNGGFGIACYATMHENPRAAEILAFILKDYRERAVPCLRTAGEGGGFAEGFYTHYWLYYWLFFCEVARICGGEDLLAAVPEFYRNRAVASIFETQPGLQERFTHANIPMGDSSAGRLCKRDRDQALAARSILVSRYRDDTDHQAVRAFDAVTPRAAFPDNAYIDYLWRDDTVPMGDLKGFRLSHFSPGPGNVYARSSWDEDAVHFYFRCGRRFTAHQHLDQGHLMIMRDNDLLGDGGHYEWNSLHAINYDIRTVAHSSMLIYDPAEKFPDYIRAAGPGLNDGGQRYPWIGTPFRHNGSGQDYPTWQAHPELHDTGTILVFKEGEAYVYTAGDVTRAYSAHKLRHFTRQIVYLRPGTFIVFDRVKSTDPSFKKTCLWQAAKVPVGGGSQYVIHNGPSRLFMQIVQPLAPEVVLNHGPHLYTYHGHTVLPDNCECRFRPEPECRIEVSPSVPAEEDCFLHVLTAVDGLTNEVPEAKCIETDIAITVRVGDTEITFRKDRVSAALTIGTGPKAIKTDLD